MNVTDLREKLRRAPVNQRAGAMNTYERRKLSDRRVLAASAQTNGANRKRIWLTPGERALIEDLYLLDEV